MRRALCCAAIALLLAIGTIARAADQATVRGFEPGRVYDFGSVDNVNLFNGNLILTIPIGQTYAVSPQLSYGLTLSYNSKVWDIVHLGYPPWMCGGAQEGYRSEPHFMSNAGLGWSVGFGRLFPPWSPANTSRTVTWTYESPDGGVHAFDRQWEALDGPDGAGATYTTDNSRLRLTVQTVNNAWYTATIEFPDGRRQVYGATGNSEWELRSIFDRFDNVISVSWDATHMVETMTDPFGRQTIITYRTWPGAEVYTRVVDNIRVPVFPGSATGNQGVYHFLYEDRRMVREVMGAICDPPVIVHIPVLTEVDLPDNSSFRMDHTLYQSPDDHLWLASPMLNLLTLPTGGRIEYAYAPYDVPNLTCSPGDGNATMGVHTRTFIHPDERRETWQYDTALSEPVVAANGVLQCPVNSTGPTISPQVPYEQRTTTVTTPLGDKEIHYFSVWQGYATEDPRLAEPSPHGFRSEEFGLGITHMVPAAGTKALSAQYFDCVDGQCPSTPARSEYLEYELHRYNSPQQLVDMSVKGSRTVFDDDLVNGVARYVDTSNDGWDGFGHYRTSVQSGNFGLDAALVSRTVLTNYNGADPEVGNPATNPSLKPALTTPLLPLTEPWILDTYPSVTTTENGITSKQLFFFDRNTGFLKRTRVRKGTAGTDGRYSDAATAQDIVTAYEPLLQEVTEGGATVTAAGHVASETYYGGDHTPLTDPSAPLATMSLTGGTTVGHTWRYGALSKTQVSGISYPTTDLTIDRNTGWPSASTDPAGRITTFTYDSMGRISGTTLPTGTKSLYTYPNASGSAPAKADAVTNGPDGALLLHKNYEFDDFGRVQREISLLADGTSSQRVTSWDALNHKTSVSEVVSADVTPASFTTYEYDAFGRPKKITPPDNTATLDHTVSIAYTGVRKVQRTQGVGRLTNADGTIREAPVTSNEESDPFGRLVRVIESDGKENPTTTTAVYGYDIGGRLSDVSVTASDAAQPQVRTFRYDNRGFLQSESHPEKSPTRYSDYDVFGNAGRRVEGADNGKFDLLLTYDPLKRLIDVSEAGGEHNMLKHFTFDALAPGDPEGAYALAGALLKAERRNYQPEIGDRTVATYYQYDSAGRVSDKKTSVRNGPSFTEHYTYDALGEVASLAYPVCTGCTPVAAGQQAAPARTIEFQRQHGFLSNVQEAGISGGPATQIGSLTYWPNGLAKEITHANGVVDRIAIDPVTNMARPVSITFENVSDCPLISGVSADPTIPRGTDATLSVTATGSNLTFQWYRGESGILSDPIAGETSATFVAQQVDTESRFWVRVGDGTCFASSRTITVKLSGCTNISITTQPSGTTVADGENTLLTVSASDSQAHFQWYAGISGDTTTPAGTDAATLQLTAIHAAASYWVRVSSADHSCSVDSNTASIALCVRPHIDVQPQSQRGAVPADPNAVVTLTASVTASGNNLQYTWYEGTPPFANQPVAGHGPALSVNFDQAHQAVRTFFVRIVDDTTMGCQGSEESAPFTMGLDNTCSIRLTGSPGYHAVFPGGNSFPLSVSVEGTGPFRYRWYHGIGGQRIELTNPAGGPNSPDIVASLGQQYDAFWCEVTVDNAACPGVGVTSAKGYVWQYGSCPLPPLTVAPLRADATGGVQPVLTATVDWPSVTYQWYRGQSGDTRDPISGATHATYTAASSARTYWVRVTDECGRNHEDSPTVVVTFGGCDPIVVNLQPGSTDIQSGDTATLSVDASSSLYLGYTWYPVGSNVPAGTGPTITVHPAVTTSYYARISSSCTTVLTIPATVHIKRCPTITVSAQPAGGYVRSDTPAAGLDLSIAATSAGGVISYQWYTGETGDTGSPIPGATLSSVHVSPQATTSYWVRLTTAACTIDSDTVVVTYCVPPHIGTIPAVSVERGQAVLMGGTATGTNVTYKWHEGSTTGPVISTSEAFWIHPMANTTYYLEVDGLCDVVYSNAVPVTVCLTPSVDEQPQSTIVFSGKTATLHVGASQATGTAVHYQWFDEHATPVGTDSATFVTPAITDTKTFSVHITSGVCSADSQQATVSVCALPEVISTGTSVNAAPGQLVTMRVTPLTPADNLNVFTWYRGTPGDYAHSTVIGGGNYEQIITATVTETYWASVAREQGCTSRTNAYTVNVCIPRITTQPAGAMLLDAAHPVQLTVAADLATSYQWYEGTSGNLSLSTPVPNGTNASVLVAPATAKHYWVRVQGSCGSADSSEAVVTVCAQPAAGSIGEYFLTRGQSVTLGASATGTGLQYQWYTGTSGDTSAPVVNATGSTLLVTPQNTTSYWLRVTGTCGTANSATGVVHVCLNPTIDLQPQSASIFSGTSTTLSVTATEATTEAMHYQWYQGTTGDLSHPVGTDSRTFTTPVLTQDTSYWVKITSSSCSTESNAATISMCLYPQSLASAGDAQIALGGVARLTGIPNNGSMQYRWFEGMSGDTSVPLTGWQSANYYDAGPPVTKKYWYQMQAGPCVSSSGTSTVSVCVPAITTQPASITINPSTSTSLTVVANTAGLTYQWYTGTSGTTTSPVAGGTAATLSVTPASTTSYWVRVTSSCGRTVDSTTATVTICQVPSITSTSPSQWIARGQSYPLSVSVTGTALQYQWYTGTSGTTTAPIAGATAASLSVSPANTTSYWVRVTGMCGTRDSVTITVSVCATPAITVQPQSVSTFSGSSATLSVTATQATTSPMTYQWYRGTSGNQSTPVAGATSSTFTTPALTADTSYWVQVSCGTCNPASSNTATVSMCLYPQSVSGAANVQTAVGQTTRLTGVTNGGSNSYLWYRGVSGDTSVPVSGWQAANYVDVGPLVTTSYWYQLQNGTCTSNSTTTTVSVCVPQITTNPQSVTIPSGSTTLTVAANTAGVTYQWYIGASGTTTSPVSGATATSLTVSPAATTTYWARATSSCGRTVDSTAATVTICTAPAITREPYNASPVPRGTASYTDVLATGSTLTYQWYLGESGDVSQPISGKTASSLTMTTMSSIRVWVRVNGQCGTRNSQAVWLSVNPVINVQPTGTTLSTGSTATVQLVASNNPLHYTWRWGNGTAIAGAPDAPTLITPAITTSTSVYCDVTSGIAVTSSWSADLTLCGGPTVTSMPVTTSSPGCKTAMVNVTGQVDNYYWYKGARGDTSVPMTSYTGMNGISACAAQAGTYWCRIVGYDQNAQASCYTDSPAVTLP